MEIHKRFKHDDSLFYEIHTYLLMFYEGHTGWRYFPEGCVVGFMQVKDRAPFTDVRCPYKVLPPT